MIVVMTNGNGTQAASQNLVPLQAPPARPGEGMLRFPESLVKDVIPFVDATYRTKADRENRAVAGLSMGGAQALYAGFNNLDRFAWIGALSGGFPLLPGRGDRHPRARERRGAAGAGHHPVHRPREVPGAPPRARRQREREAPPLLPVHRRSTTGSSRRMAPLKKLLDDKGVKYALLEVPGYGHEWKFWRLSLRDLLPRLFQPGASRG